VGASEITRVVFDLDTFIYRCGFAAQHKWYVLVNRDDQTFLRYDSMKALKAENPDADKALIFSTIDVEPVENALHSFKIAVQSVLDKFNTETYCGFLSDGNGFRDQIATTLPYKGNRDPLAKPVHYKKLREYATETWSAQTVSDMEADDAVGIAARDPGDDASLICTNDKDLDGIPGWHYNWTKPDSEAYYITPKEAKFNFYVQCLTGDSTDNIPGLKGVGPVTAKKLLEGVSGPLEAEERILKAYITEYGDDHGPERFLETARLVYILRKPEERDNPLWQPISASAG
jgi:DNA polymerase I